LLAAVAYKQGPVAIRFPRGRAWDFKKEKNPTAVQIGKSRIIKKGRDITIVNLGALLPYVIKATDEVEKENKIKVEIIDARFAKPMDKAAILKSIRKTKKIITIEEGATEGGFGQSVLELAKKGDIKNMESKILGIPDRFIEQGTMEELRKECGLTAAGIKNAILEIL
jgi:1-deoxy-D-xylulose-5-phosphate synthase